MQRNSRNRDSVSVPVNKSMFLRSVILDIKVDVIALVVRMLYFVYKQYGKQYGENEELSFLRNLLFKLYFGLH